MNTEEMLVKIEIHDNRIRFMSKRIEEAIEKAIQETGAAKRIKDIKEAIRDTANATAEIEKELKNIALAKGKSLSAEGCKVSVTYIKPGTRWDKKALVGYAAANPSLNELATKTPPRATIRRKRS